MRNRRGALSCWNRLVKKGSLRNVEAHPAHHHHYSLKRLATLVFLQPREINPPQAVWAERQPRLFGVHRLR
jgi:hypothetical protein